MRAQVMTCALGKRGRAGGSGVNFLLSHRRGNTGNGKLREMTKRLGRNGETDKVGEEARGPSFIGKSTCLKTQRPPLWTVIRVADVQVER